MKRGDRVMCIARGRVAEWVGKYAPRIGEVYTVRDVFPSLLHIDEQAIRVVEIVNPPMFGEEPFFSARGFRKLDDIPEPQRELEGVRGA